MKDAAAREFAGGLIGERLKELASAVQAATPAATQEDGAQNWEELG